MLILIDTLRADHLPCYGYARNTAPQICGLAERSLLFEDVTATSSWTKPSTASLLSGLYPKSHGALSERESLPDDVVILPEILRARGYRTQAISGNGIVGPEWNFDQGYDDFVQFDDPTGHIRSDTVNEWALEFLDGLTAERFFLFVHYVDPHDPYTPPESHRVFSLGQPKPSLERFIRFAKQRPRANPLAAQINYYDDEILFNDSSAGRLLDALASSGRSQRTVVAITSDHGEEFFEHGLLTHRKQLYEESLRVPLVIFVPGAAPARIPEPISLVDVLPTLLSILGIEPPGAIDGADALGPRDRARAIFAEHRDFGRELYSMRRGSDKVIEHRAPEERTEAYRLTSDPTERSPLRGPSELSAVLRDWIDDGRRAHEARELTPEQAEILQKLGYAEP